MRRVLTEAQRLRKNQRERERRARIKAAASSSVTRRLLPPPGIVTTVNVALVIDASGSMFTLRDKAIEQVNRQVQHLREQARATGQQTKVSIYFFNNRGALRTFASAYDVERVPVVGSHNYYPQGQTALLDAIRDVTEDLRNVDDGARNTTFLVVVVTDGQENDSYTTKGVVQQLLRERQATDRWTYALLMPPGGRSYALSLGIPEGNIQEWEATYAGLARAGLNVNSATTSYYSSVARGQTATKSFFTDLSKVGTADLRKLDDLTGSFKHWKVDNESDIRPFVEAHGVSYQIGKAYYQLTKAEKVQNHKDFVIREKTTKRLYGGDQARNLVGISRSAGTEVRVHPGNHANYDLFVQSTSTNRKLVRGTTLLYRIN